MDAQRKEGLTNYVRMDIEDLKIERERERRNPHLQIISYLDSK